MARTEVMLMPARMVAARRATGCTRRRTQPNGLGAALSAAALVLTLAQPAHAQRSDLLRDLDTRIESARGDWGVAGVAVAIVRNDSVIYARGFGVRENGRPERVDEHTLFAIGSNTKAFTAAGIGLMVDEGRMSWDDPVTKHLPEFQLFDPYVTREMRLRDVLSHRSGLGRRGDGIWYGTPFDRAEVIRRVRYLEPSSSFRSEYGYQNIMYITAGEALARTAGMSWDDVMRTRLLEPLGMRRSNTSVKQLQGVDNVATPHSKRDGAAVPVPWRDIDNAGPAGSINSSVMDMTQWLRMLLGRGELDGRRILSAAVVRELHQPHTITGSGTDPNFPMTHFAMYGLGLGLRDYYGHKLLMHTGGIDGMLSNVALLPNENIGVVVLTNTDGQSLGTVLTFTIIDALIQAPARDWNGISLRRDAEAQAAAAAARTAAQAARVQGTRPSLPVAEYAGEYEDEMNGDVVVTHENGTLVLRRLGTFAATLEHWHYDTWRGTWSEGAQGDIAVTFRLNAAGRPTALEIQGLGEFRRAAPAR